MSQVRHKWTFEKANSREAAEAHVDTVELLDSGQVQSYFPKAQVWREEFATLTKSIVAYHRDREERLEWTLRSRRVARRQLSRR